MCKHKRLKNIAHKNCDFSDKQNMVAVVERGGNVISIGYNDMSRSHPAYFNGEHDKGIHAEYAALRQTNNTEGANIHIFYFRKNGDLGNSKPCPDCMEEIKKSGIQKIFYIDNGERKSMRLYGK